MKTTCKMCIICEMVIGKDETITLEQFMTEVKPKLDELAAEIEFEEKRNQTFIIDAFCDGHKKSLKEDCLSWPEKSKQSQP